MSLIGWVGNIFIVIGLWKVGNKERSAFVFSFIGEVLWVGYAVYLSMYDLGFVCLIFAVLAARNYTKWSG